MRYLFCLLLLGNFIANTSASVSPVLLEQDGCEADTLAPKVFMIGEHERQYEHLMGEYSMLLLTACDNDMNFAFNKWQGMLAAMESHAESIDYDLKGVKLWLNVFWEEGGGIKHIAYYLKPTSRNVDTEKLTMFFISFVNNYTFPLMVGENFSHYGMAAFPTFYKKEIEEPARSEGTTPLVKDTTKSPKNNHEK